MTTAAPQVDAVSLADLVPGYAGDLGPRETVEGLVFEGIDVGGVDLTGLTARECAFADAALSETLLRAASFLSCTFDRLDAPVLSAPRSRLHEVALAHSRIGSGELYESDLERVRFSDCKLGYLNLRGSTLTDVIFESCTIDELDLGGATGTRVALVDCDLRSLDLSHARLADFDLRGAELQTITGLDGLAGATLSELQVTLMAGLFAGHLGIRVE